MARGGRPPRPSDASSRDIASSSAVSRHSTEVAHENEDDPAACHDPQECPAGLSIRLGSGGTWVCSGEDSVHTGQPAAPAEVHVTATPNPFPGWQTLEAFSKTPAASGFLSSSSGDLPPTKSRRLSTSSNGSGCMKSGLAVLDLLQITSDPKVQKRIRKADVNKDGRISRRDILDVMQSERSAKKKLKWGLIIGGTLLLVCLLMLAANAALTYVVVNMSRETSVQSNGVLTDKAGSTVVGTAQAAELADLLYAYATPQDASATLLAVSQLLVTTEAGIVTVYKVLASRLVPGQRLEFSVAAPPAESDGAQLVAAEYQTIVIDDTGVHSVPSGGDGTAQAGGRRLLAAPGSRTAGVQGLMPNIAATTCATGSKSCSAAVTAVSCPSVPTCGTDGKAYSGPCQAVQAGTQVKCTMCANCAGSSRPGGLPANLAMDSQGYVRTRPPSPTPPSPAPPPQAKLAQTKRPHRN